MKVSPRLAAVGAGAASGDPGSNLSDSDLVRDRGVSPHYSTLLA